MDPIQPVGAEVQPPQPVNALATLQGILGIQQQRQALTQGQEQIGILGAEEQQQQQKNSELVAAQSVLQKVHAGGYRNSDGTLNRQQLADDLTAIGPYATAQGTEILGQANAIVQNQQARQSLSETQQKQLSGAFTELAQQPDVTPNDVANRFGMLVEENPQLAPMVMRILAYMPNKGLAGAPLQQKLAQMAAASGGPALGAPSAVNTGSQELQGTTSPYTGAFSPASAVTMQLTPAQRLPQGTTNAAGQIINRNPITGALTPAPIGQLPQFNQGAINPTPAESAASINPTTPQVQSQATLAGTDNQRYSQISQGGTTAQTGISLAEQVENLAAQVQTGKLSKEWTDRLAALAQHQPGITARQMLGKYAAQLQTMALQNAPTDSARAQIESGMPNPDTMDPDAVIQAAQYMGGLFGMNKARQQIADQYKQRTGGTMGLTGVDDAFTRSADPLVFAYQQLPAGEERQEFLRSHGITSRAAIESFATRLNQVKHYVGQ